MSNTAPVAPTHPTDTYLADITELVLPPDGCCFHCGDPLPNAPFYTPVLGAARAMCCLGCELAAQSIVEAGLEQYYLDRSTINRTASLPDALYQLQAYDHRDVQAQFVYQQDHLSVAELSVANLRCAACSWLIESRLHALDGVAQCQVNLTQQRMRVLWDDTRLPISQILAAIQAIGYDAKPYRQDTHVAMLARHNRRMVFQLGVAALGAMQAMMFAVGMYFGDYYGMAAQDKQFLRWVSLFVSIPVVLLAGAPFFASAWSALRARQVNMDVPIALAIVLTFAASMYATTSGTGETYYDSVSMLIFFLLAGKYVEHNARSKAANLAQDLVVVEPILVAKLGTHDVFTANQLAAMSGAHMDALLKNADTVTPDNLVSAPALNVGDIVRIDAGSSVISDGILLSARATVSQSLLTGESDLIVKQRGDTIVGGSQNDSQPFVMQVTALPDDSQIGIIDRLVNRALSEKPQIALRADRMARWFVARVLLIASVVFIAWYIIEPAQAVWATVAVLVATCPCALSLATPIALTVATNRLASLGFLATRGHTLGALANVTHVAFDKTGTLTYGQPKLLHIETLSDADSQANADALLAIAAGMEVGSRHPIAHALLGAASQLHLPTLTHLQHVAGGGITAAIGEQHYRLGHSAFALAAPHASQGRALSDLPDSDLPNLAAHSASTSVTLSRQTATGWQALAHFYFHDKVRETAQATVAGLQAAGIEVLILTGDPSAQAQQVGQALGIDAVYQGLTPDDKLAHIKTLQAQGAVVQMVGDGVNDAPVLAGADVSTAMAGAADLAQVASDSVLIGGNLTAIRHAHTVARKTEHIIKQNMRWAIGYNIAVLMPAALGYVPPWLAAIGMSLSSFGVVMNALRLKRA